MGLTKATLDVKGRKGATKIELSVDTGSVYTWIPTESLESLGITKDDFVDFRTIEGRRVRRSAGEAILGYDGVSRH